MEALLIFAAGMDVGIIKATLELMVILFEYSQRINEAGRAADVKQKFHDRPGSLKNEHKKSKMSGDP
jgi:hypothetical protein